VASSDGDTSLEQLTFDGKAGTYRYAVNSVQGAGDYTLSISVP
jgi:hypothetical protein